MCNYVLHLSARLCSIPLIIGSAASLTFLIILLPQLPLQSLPFLSLFPPATSHLAVSFSLIPLPASTFTHSSSKSVFHPLLIFLTLLSRLQFYFT